MKRPAVFPPRRRSSRADRKSTRLNSSHERSSYAVVCLKKKKKIHSGGGSNRIPERCHFEPQTRSDTGAPAGSQPVVFFFNDTAASEIYTLSLHDALPI